MRRATGTAIILGTGMLAAGLLLSSGAGASPQDPKAEGTPQARRQMPDLIQGLKDTPGCLGVETARTQSGKQVIFAWFENKKAAMAWYNSKTHRFYQEMMGGSSGRPPMAQVPEDQPFLCIASITPSKEQKIEGAPYPISQISIELYSVLPGGASMGGTFAPKSLKIPNHLSYEEVAEKGEKPDEKAEVEKKSP
jgi:hypothetical protein